MSNRKIAVFTGNRAEYGMQYPVLSALSEHPDLDYYLLVSGAHLKDDFGRTLQEIEADGFTVHAKVAMDMPDSTLKSTVNAIGSGIVSLATIFDELKPDLALVFADRFESFSAMIASTNMRIPTAHVEGGDYTEGGALDDSVRHAMTKLAHLHFTTNQAATERVMKLGEEPWRIHTVGLPSLDLIKSGDYAAAGEVVEKTGIDPDAPLVIFTQHSVTTEFDSAGEQIGPSLEALVRAGQELGCQIIITYPNDDAGGAIIREELLRLSRRNLPFLRVIPNLGRRLYHGVLAIASACVGNSSSGIKETPAFGCPTVNIGSRQQGRLRGGNVLDVDYDSDAIFQAIRKCIEDEDFRVQAGQTVNPYGTGDAGIRIAEILATTPLNAELIRKKMTY